MRWHAVTHGRFFRTSISYNIFTFKQRNYVADLGDKKFTNSVRDIAWMMLAYASYRFAPHLVIVLYLLFTNKV